jgi:hypothetical protein
MNYALIYWIENGVFVGEQVVNKFVGSQRRFWNVARRVYLLNLRLIHLKNQDKPLK